jgi:hypothetical protein
MGFFGSVQAEPLASVLRVSSRDRFADSHRPRRPSQCESTRLSAAVWDGFADSQRPATTAGAVRSVPKFESSTATGTLNQIPRNLPSRVTSASDAAAERPERPRSRLARL